MAQMTRIKAVAYGNRGRSYTVQCDRLSSLSNRFLLLSLSAFICAICGSTELFRLLRPTFNKYDQNGYQARRRFRPSALQRGGNGTTQRPLGPFEPGMSQQKTSLNSRKGRGTKAASNGSNANSSPSGSAGVRTARQTTAALRSKVAKNAKASGPTPAEKRHAGIRRSTV
jgi:hypothetical protein